jgi:spore coat protein JB
MNNNDNSRSTLLRTIQIYSFALKDIQLYLDTHPKCMRALAYFNKYKTLRQKAVCEFNELYGPLTYEENNSSVEWNWISSPWPWERCDN